MHVAAWICGHLFFLLANYLFPDAGDKIHILDVGSSDVNGNLKDAMRTANFYNGNYEYVGLDMDSNALNVDVFVEPGQYPLNWPFEQESFDIIVSNSCLEHDDFYWETFAHMVEKLKPGGLIYINVPSVFDVHRFPVDNWRFLPDSATALAKWANRGNKASDMNIHVLYSQVIPHNYFSDLVMVFQKSNEMPSSYSIFLLNFYKHYIYNYMRHDVLNEEPTRNEFFDKITDMDVKKSLDSDPSGRGLISDAKLIMSDDMLSNLSTRYLNWYVHCREPYKQSRFEVPLSYTEYYIASSIRVHHGGNCYITYVMRFQEADLYNQTYVHDTWHEIMKAAHLHPDEAGMLDMEFRIVSQLPKLREAFYETYPNYNSNMDL